MLLIRIQCIKFKQKMSWKNCFDSFVVYLYELYTAGHR